MATLQECIDLYHARQAARTPVPAGEGDSGTSAAHQHGRAKNLVLSPESFSPSSPFAALLMRYRAAAGLSRPQLARLLVVDPSYVWLLEQGRRLPSLSLTLRIAEVLMLGSMQRIKLLAAAGFSASVRRVRAS